MCDYSWQIEFIAARNSADRTFSFAGVVYKITESWPSNILLNKPASLFMSLTIWNFRKTFPECQPKDLVTNFVLLEGK